jgi:outer membrane protein TolC
VESQDTFTTAVETVEERLEAEEPNVTQQDLLRLRVGLASVTKEIFTLERAIAVTRGALKRQLGLPAEGDFDIADMRLEPVELRLQPLAVYLDNMAQHRPEIAQIEAGLEAQKARLEAARSAYYPSIFLAGGLEYSVAPNREDQDSPFAKDFNNLSGPGVALGIRWQLDFWMTRAKVAERLAEVAKVEVQKTNAASGIELEIQRRYLEMQEYQNQLEAMQTARRSARALLLTTLTNFNLGVGEAKDIFDALGLYTRTLSDYYEVLRDFNIGAARLSQATGEEVTTLQYGR